MPDYRASEQTLAWAPSAKETDHVQHRQGRRVQARRPHGQAARLRRHAARRARRVRPAEGSRRRRGRAARGGRAAASTTSTPAISTARTSPIRSSARRCIPIPTISSSSPRSAPGAARTLRGSRRFSREELTQAVHDNLRNLGLDALEVVNLRSMFGVHGPVGGSIEAPLTVARRASAPGPGAPHRLEQRHADPDRRGTQDLRDRLRAEPLQYRASGRRRADRPTRARRRRLRRRFSRSAGLRRCSRRSCPTSRGGSARRRCRSRSPGCWPARPTSC